MPNRTEARISINNRFVNIGAIDIAPKAFQDFWNFKLLLKNNPEEEFIKRALVRSFIIFLDAWYSSTTYLIEFQITLERFNSNGTEITKRWIDLNLSVAEQELIFESRIDRITPKKLLKTIKLLEKFLKVTKPFQFGSNNTWIFVRDTFSRRNDFTHPKEAKNFEVYDIDSLLSASMPIVEHLLLLWRRMYNISVIVSYEYCKEKCSCGAWKQEGRESEYKKAKAEID